MAAKFRKIDPRIWNDEKFVAMTLDEKLLAFWLLTNSRLNRVGVVLWSPGLASEETGIDRHRVDTVCHTVCHTLNWVFDTRSKLVFLTTWWKYNTPDNESALKGQLEDLHDLPKNDLNPHFIRASEYLKPSLRHLVHTVCPTVPDTVGDTVSPQKKEKEKKQEGKIVPSELPAPPAGVVPPTSPPPPPEQSKQPRKKSASDQPPPIPPTTALVTTNDPAGSEMVPAKPKSVHQSAIDEFCDRWRVKYKEKYPFNGGKDGQSVAWMLTQVEQDLSKFTAVVARFLSDDDPFYAAGDRHGLGKLRQHFARWLVNQPIQTPQRTKAEREADDIRRYSTSMYDDLPSMYDTDKGNF